MEKPEGSLCQEMEWIPFLGLVRRKEKYILMLYDEITGDYLRTAMSIKKGNNFEYSSLKQIVICKHRWAQDNLWKVLQNLNKSSESKICLKRNHPFMTIFKQIERLLTFSMITSFSIPFSNIRKLWQGIFHPRDLHHFTSKSEISLYPWNIINHQTLTIFPTLPSTSSSKTNHLSL